MKKSFMEALFDEVLWQRCLEEGTSEKHLNANDMMLMSNPKWRANFRKKIEDGDYEIMPPVQKQIPKDNGEYRTVYVNSRSEDRIFLAIINELLFNQCFDMVHESCKSYQAGIGCGNVVKSISSKLEAGEKGFKADLSKYFDSVPIQFIDECFDRIEQRIGKNPAIDIVRKYYHDERLFSLNGELIMQYQSLRQGCAVSSFLADAMLFHIDEKLSNLKGFYVRYSDDILYIGPNADSAKELLEVELKKMGLSLNPNKVENIDSREWFKFLGFSIRGKDISISKEGLKKFEDEIRRRTVGRLKSKNSRLTMKQAVSSVNSFLYVGNGQYSWATQKLPIINVKNDIDIMNYFVMNCIRAAVTGKKGVGSLAYNKGGLAGVVVSGKGKNVTANIRKIPGKICGYRSIGNMWNIINTDKCVYNLIVAQL